MAKRILVVDDEPDMLEVAVFRLEKSGYEIITAANGQEAQSLIEKTAPDLVLLDLVLPRMSGYELCKWIKADHRLRHIPVILFTAGAIGIREKMKGAGAQDYLIKPFEQEELLSKVKKLIGGGP